MSAIDFKEIPRANTGSGEQDAFELFARDFLEGLGFRIIEGPSRGADGGRDLLVGEALQGIVSQDEKKWLVSAKHKAHKGGSVSNEDEPDIKGRVDKFEADGFMGFYSTIPSSGLDTTLVRLKGIFSIFIYDKSRIENTLFTEPSLRPVFQRYFPASYQAYRDEVVHAKENVRFTFGTLRINCSYLDKNRSSSPSTYQASNLLGCVIPMQVNNQMDQPIGFSDIYIVFEREGKEVARCVPNSREADHSRVDVINVEPHRIHHSHLAFNIYGQSLKAVKGFTNVYFTAKSSGGLVHKIPLTSEIRESGK